MNIKLISVIALITSSMSWGLMFFLGNQVLASIHPFYLSAIRYFIAGIVLMPILILKEGFASLKWDKDIFKIVILGIVGIAGTNLFMWYGIMLSNDLLGAIIDGLIPFTSIILFSIIYRQLPSIRIIFTSCISFIGVFMVISKGNLDFLQHSFYKGALILYISTIFWSMYSMGPKHFYHISSLRFTTITSFYASIFMVLLDIVLSHLNLIPKLDWLNVWQARYSLLYIGILGSCIAVFCWNYGLKHLGAVHGTLFINLIPISTFLVNIVVGNHFIMIEIMGFLLSIIGVCIHYFFNLKQS